MPIYEYVCQGCEHRFEVKQKMSDDPLTDCPRCGKPVSKVISAPAIMFKGSGWYVTDYSDKMKPPGQSESPGKPANGQTEPAKETAAPTAPATPAAAASAPTAAPAAGAGTTGSSTPSAPAATPSASTPTPKTS